MAAGLRKSVMRAADLHRTIQTDTRMIRGSVRRRLVHAQAVASPQPASARGASTLEAACPICQQTKFSLGPGAGRLQCDRCARTFTSSDPKYVDLTLEAGMEGSTFSEGFWQGTELFRRPTVSAVYERGWRQGFAWAGFPGADAEFRYAMEYLESHQGETLVDLSCGSGLFTRRFASSGKFKTIIASDYSESMLKQTDQLINEDTTIDGSKVLLLRADVGRLPFATGSVNAIHAGAAIHCWPSPSGAAAEISRVLKPGGHFVGSTFLDGTAPLGQFLGNDSFVAPLRAIDPTTQFVSRQYRWWSEGELRDLFASVGLTSWQRQRQNRFILWSVCKSGGVQQQQRSSARL